KEGFIFKGTGSAQSRSLRSLVHWLDGELPNTRGYGAFDVSSKLEMRGNEIVFDNAKLKLDNTNAVASGRINLSGSKPVVNAKVAADQIDLSAYISAFGEMATRKSQGLVNQDRRSLTNLIESINQPNSQVVVTGSTAKSNSDRVAKKSDRAPTNSELSVEGLNSANLDVNFQLEKLLFSNIQIEKSNIDVRLKDGLLSANLKNFGLYGGQGQGQVKIDSRKSVPDLSSVLDIKGVSALPFLKDAANFDWISGKTRLAIDVVGSGTSDQEIRSSLQGKGSILFENGAIEGINIPQIMRAFGNGRISGWSRETSLKTDFSELSGTFTINKGVANNSDLQLTGPLMRLTGGGEVNIVKENLDYVVRPKLVASLEGQGAQQSDLQGLEVPVRIKGPWKKPRISPDIEGIVNDPAAMTNTINNAAKAIKKLGKNKDFESMINGVLNGQSGGDPANQSEGQSFNANKILEQLTR
ncbi:MAG: AsmA-like C-terminal region-containing protein, partial [Methyloligellaceae bacterium]